MEMLFSFVAGIGSIPDAVLSKLTDHRDLGVHSEMFSDGIIDLVHQGVITNAKKAVQTGKILGSFAYGSKRLYDFMDNNPFVGECSSIGALKNGGHYANNNLNAFLLIKMFDFKIKISEMFSLESHRW